MIDKLRKLADLRREFLRLDGLYRQAKVDWEKGNVELIEKRDKITVGILNAENTIKAQALDQFRLDGNRKPVPGIEVKDFKVLNYQEKDALAWGYKAGMGLKLDTKALESIARATTLDFVEVRIENRCQIATDLDKALEGVKV